MCWHVIRSFHSMLPRSRAALWNNFVKECFGVSLYIRVIVLIDGQGSTCVLQEQMRQAALEPGEIALNLPQNLGGDEVAAAALGRDDDGLLGPLGGHGTGRGRRDGLSGGGGGGGDEGELCAR